MEVLERQRTKGRGREQEIKLGLVLGEKVDSVKLKILGGYILVGLK